jgi:hypothetical protein
MLFTIELEEYTHISLSSSTSRSLANQNNAGVQARVRLPRHLLLRRQHQRPVRVHHDHVRLRADGRRRELDRLGLADLGHGLHVHRGVGGGDCERESDLRRAVSGLTWSIFGPLAINVGIRYYSVSRLAPPKWVPVLCWVDGWLNLMGQIAGIA